MTLSETTQRSVRRADANEASERPESEDRDTSDDRLVMVRGCTNKKGKKVMSIRQFFEQIKSS